VSAIEPLDPPATDAPPVTRVTTRNLHFNDFDDLVEGWVCR
jgi:hypothetical protein